MSAGYPQSLNRQLERLLALMRQDSPSPALLVQLSMTYFDMAGDLLTDDAKRRAAFEAGAQAAQRAIDLDESNADAHFFHAANLGSAERLGGLTNGALVLKDVKHCALRAIELNPRHAQALQFMGGLLMELPWWLGGDEKKAQTYLERAVSADGNFTLARIHLAKLYRKQGRLEEAKAQLEAVIRADRPHYRYSWEREYKPEAERFLRELGEVRKDS
jgi:tetratricopeptide (TPR) repeat protein